MFLSRPQIKCGKKNGFCLFNEKMTLEKQAYGRMKVAQKMYPSHITKLLEILSEQLHLLCYATIVYVVVHKIKAALEGTGKSVHLVVISATYYKNSASG